MPSSGNQPLVVPSGVSFGAVAPKIPHHRVRKEGRVRDMARVNLSARDINVLDKIKDPESNPAANVVIDDSLPRDPHVTDPATYESMVEKERTIIKSIQSIESELSQSHAENAQETAVTRYCECLSQLDDLIAAQPRYSSARNNRAQVLRRLYGDMMLLDVTTGMPMPLIEQPELSDRRQAAATTLQDLQQSIELLSPAAMSTPLSPQAARTLSMAHTQRAAIYLKTSKMLSHRRLDLVETRPEASWSKLDFEEAAARDLAYGGRYGNEIAKSLAVSVNPTAKLCAEQQDTMKFLKVGRVAIITRGRYAGKKVVILQPVDNGNKPHPFGHAIVAGIERYPSKITRRMSKARQEKRSKIKPFIKVINYNHLMPTRYTLELEGLKGTISGDTFKEVSQREDAKKTVKKVLEERYTSGKNRWFFSPLRF
ncbi:hypothetical protein CP533_2510 [Ophiocordyceps camponoti-saundersi (nom. inval.)]|nr:hypothetical protein CP533_2510 [Ophiocordyceps camponoti-saundersi (nom. inval.)]